MENFVTLVGHLAWPIVVVLIIFVFRRQLLGAAESIRHRLGETEAAANLKFGPVEVTLEAVTSQVEALAADQRTLHSVVAQSGLVVPADGPTSDEIPEQLLSMSEQYLSVRIADRGRRLRAKNDLAVRMGAMVIAANVSRELIAQQDDEGLLLAMAEAVRFDPREADLALLLATYGQVTRLHVRYRYAMSFGRLAEERLIPSIHFPEVELALASFEDGADAALQSRVDGTRILLERTPI